MSAQIPVSPEPSSDLELPEDFDARAARRAARRARRTEGGPAWLGGALLLALGLIFLAQNLGVFTFRNWWALFIFIPAVASLGAAWDRYRDAGGQVTSDVLSSLVGGLIFGFVAVILLFDINLGINWVLFWPLLLILGGAAMLLKVLWR
jgi:hypothetical protein